MEQPKIVMVDDDDVMSMDMKNFLQSKGITVFESSYETVCRTHVQEKNVDLLLLGSSRGAGSEVLTTAKRIRELDRTVPIVMLVENSSAEHVIAALRAGVNDYFKYPFKKEDMFSGIERCLSGNHSKKLPPFLPEKSGNAQDLIGESRVMQSVRTHINQASRSDSNVLITGETGTGKELVANLIHRNSSRSKNPFICINCTAIPDHLLESELFGHEKGSFTGADTLNAGKFQLAEGGAVFLDEIGDMSLSHQAKILRAIESKEIQRVGGKNNIPLNIKIIAATNQNLEQMVADGKFRKDLYYRLNVTNINIPPLRERKEDIPSLLNFFIRKFNGAYQKEIKGVDEEAMGDLLNYTWPGNVREMKNMLESSFMNFHTRWITLMDLPERFRTKVMQSGILHYSEKDRVLNALVTTNWNKSKAAMKLKWSRMTLYRKVAKYQLSQSTEHSCVDNVS